MQQGMYCMKKKSSVCMPSCLIQLQERNQLTLFTSCWGDGCCCGGTCGDWGTPNFSQSSPWLGPHGKHLAIICAYVHSLGCLDHQYLLSSCNFVCRRAASLGSSVGARQKNFFEEETKYIDTRNKMSTSTWRKCPFLLDEMEGANQKC